MSFTISCELDITDGFEPDALLGTILFSDGQRLLQERAVYLDTWLCALKKAAKNIKVDSKETLIDIVEESQPLQVVRDSSGLVHVSFRGKEVTAPTITHFQQSVRDVIDLFVSRVRELTGGDYDLPCGSL